MLFLRWLARGVIFVRHAWRRAKMLFLRPAFQCYGRHFRFDPDGHYTFEHIEVGDDVSLGTGAILLATESRILIGNKVMFGPNVIVVGGNHNTSLIGRFMYDVQEKRPEDDQDVIIEDDVWVGSGAVILKGVRIGRGSVVAAGAVVTRDVLPYTVVGGVPARSISVRFGNLRMLLEHESALYPPEKRLSKQDLERTLENGQRIS
jgi:acetyltransferase-like isoleucine patch superfamily enzyme